MCKWMRTKSRIGKEIPINTFSDSTCYNLILKSRVVKYLISSIRNSPLLDRFLKVSFAPNFTIVCRYVLTLHTSLLRLANRERG